MGVKILGEKVTAVEYNRNVGLDTQTAGETINGATLPVASFLLNSDDEIYACDADDQTKLEFHGFAISDGTDGNDIEMQYEGIVSGFTALTKGAKYYVQDDKTLGTTPGSNTILVGVAISATEIQIIKSSKHIENPLTLVASDDIKASADTERSVTGQTFVLKKEIIVRQGGEIRVTYDLKDNSGTQTATLEVRDEFGNVLGTGTETGSAYATKTHNIDIRAFTKIQAYLKNSGGGNTSSMRNFRIKFNTSSDSQAEVNTD